MRQFLAYLSLAIVLSGCKKSNTQATGAKPVPDANTPSQGSTPNEKTSEPLQVALKQKIKTGIPEVSRLAISADGTRVALSSDGLGNREQIEVWDLVPTPKRVKAFSGVMRALSPDGKLVTRPSKESAQTEVVDATTGTVVCVVPDAGYFHQFSGLTRLVLGSIQATPQGMFRAMKIRQYDALTGKLESEFEIPDSERPEIRGPVNGGKELVLGWEAKSRVEVWDLETKAKVRDFTMSDARPKGSWSNFETSQDGRRVTAKRDAKGINVYDVATGAEVATIGHPTTCAFVPGREVILGHNTWFDKNFNAKNGWRAHDISKNAIIADLPGGYLFPAISKDGKTMVTMADRVSSELIVWDLAQIP